MSQSPIFIYLKTGQLWRAWEDHFTIENVGLLPGDLRPALNDFPDYLLVDENLTPNHAWLGEFKTWKERQTCAATPPEPWIFACRCAKGHEGPHRYQDRTWREEGSTPRALLAVEVEGEAYFRNTKGLWESIKPELLNFSVAAGRGFDGYGLLYESGKIECGNWHLSFGSICTTLAQEREAWREFMGGAKTQPAPPTPDTRGFPEGHCSFCVDGPATRWGTGDWKICGSPDCLTAHRFHEERCAQGSVDTEATRAESLRYGKRWLADLSQRDAKKKLDGACWFCCELAEQPNHPDTVSTCGKHERAGWRLTHLLALGGVCDTPELREEVLRHVAASDRFLEEGRREATGARTPLDYKIPSPYDIEHPSLTEQKPPPEEIPLVGITPHYEWP